MKSFFIEQQFEYDGSQLRSLYAYLNHSILGNSIIAWAGPCRVDFDKMIDGEDLLQKSAICGDFMLHFIIEIFDQNLMTGVSLQRLFASIVKEYLEKKTQQIFLREGDDIYWNNKKLSISIASTSPRSTMIHFAINISNQGTPVPTCSLSDFNLSSTEVAQSLLESFKKEFISVQEATWKVKNLS